VVKDNLLFHQLKENGETTTVNSVHYLHQLRTKFMPALRRESDDLQTVWFQQDGATLMVLIWLKETFGDRLISYRTERPRSQHSPDLNSLDFFLWGFLNDRYTTQNHGHWMILKGISNFISGELSRNV
jgi:hypothetical protein